MMYSFPPTWGIRRNSPAPAWSTSTSLRTYAIGHLVLWVPNSISPDRDHVRDARQEIRIFCCYRRCSGSQLRTRNMLLTAARLGRRWRILDVRQKVAGKLVFGENISQAAQFVQSGNAQAGLIALSLAMSPAMKAAGRYWELPVDTYPAMQQGVAILRRPGISAQHKPLSTIVSSSEGAAILEQYGFRVPQANDPSGTHAYAALGRAWCRPYCSSSDCRWRTGWRFRTAAGSLWWKRLSRCQSCCRLPCSVSTFWLLLVP